MAIHLTAAQHPTPKMKLNWVTHYSFEGYFIHTLEDPTLPTQREISHTLCTGLTSGQYRLYITEGITQIKVKLFHGKRDCELYSESYSRNIVSLTEAFSKVEAFMLIDKI